MRRGVSVIDDDPPLVAMGERMKGKRGKSEKVSRVSGREGKRRDETRVPIQDEENEFLCLPLSHL